MNIFEKRGLSPKIVKSFEDDKKLYSILQMILEKSDLNTNTFKNLIRYLREIKLRDQIEYEEILGKIQFYDISEKAEFSEKTKGELLMSRLYCLRFPLWSEKQSQFQKLGNKFQAATGGKIIFPDFAEGNSFSIVFNIKHEKDIENLFDNLLKGKILLAESLKALKD